jgi:8-oxo-dGTP diphosphatase
MAKPKTPLLAADCVAVDAAGCVLLIRRRFPPFAGKRALPGGFVEVGETVEEGCRRELMEETGLRPGTLKLVGVYSDPLRDPRGHTVSVAFATRVRRVKARPGDDAAALEWIEDWRAVELAFDHARILKDAWRLLGLGRAAGAKFGS